MGIKQCITWQTNCDKCGSLFYTVDPTSIDPIKYQWKTKEMLIEEAWDHGWENYSSDSMACPKCWSEME